MEKLVSDLIKFIDRIKDTNDKVAFINKVKLALHEISPMKNEPVDCVLWVPNSSVIANDYNPNVVAPPEMELLRVSIESDGYTQPIVTMHENGNNLVIDGFHRTRVGQEFETVKNRVHGFLPITSIRDDRSDRGDRIAATIRHNRARGKHVISGMSDIVVELKRRNWSDQKIARELGMDADEILRLCQITGLAEMFKDNKFSKAWEIDSDTINEEDKLEIEE